VRPRVQTPVLGEKKKKVRKQSNLTKNTSFFLGKRKSKRMGVDAKRLWREEKQKGSKCWMMAFKLIADEAIC
jgi:hypothetical protein